MAFRWFKKLETDVHELNYLFWECTTRCNLRCLHCGSDCRSSSHIPDMPLVDFLHALDTIPHVPKRFTIAITGGEPLLRKDLAHCGDAICRRGMGWGMVSNGMLYVPQTHATLMNAGMGALTISLDGMENSHNWLRGSVSCFAKTFDAIGLAANEKHLNFDVVTCVHRRNIDELPQIQNLLMQSGVRAWRLFTITPIGRAKNYDDLFLTNQEFTRLMDFIVEARKEMLINVKFSCEGYVGRYEMRVRDTPFFCRAGINIASVLADGGIGACPNIDRNLTQGNIYYDNLYNVWQNRFEPYRNRRWLKTAQCAACRSWKDCHGNGMHNRRNGELLTCHNNKIC